MPVKSNETAARETLANEINDALAEADTQGLDKRLEAAIKLAEVRATFGTDKGSTKEFRSWVDQNIEKSWVTVRALVKMGKEGDGKEGDEKKEAVRAVLTKAREYNAAKMKERRKKANTKKAPRSREAQIKSAVGMLKKALTGYTKTKVLGCDVSAKDLRKIIDQLAKAAKPEPVKPKKAASKGNGKAPATKGKNDLRTALEAMKPDMRQITLANMKPAAIKKQGLEDMVSS